MPKCLAIDPARIRNSKTSPGINSRPGTSTSHRRAACHNSSLFPGSAQSCARNADPVAVLQRLKHGLAAGSILLLHDGHARRTAQGRPVLLDVLPALLQQCHAAGLRPVTLADALPNRHA